MKMIIFDLTHLFFFTKMMLFKHNIVYLTSICLFSDPYLTNHRYSYNNCQAIFCTCQALQSSVSCSFAIFILAQFSLLRRESINLALFLFFDNRKKRICSKHRRRCILYCLLFGIWHSELQLNVDFTQGMCVNVFVSRQTPS